MFRQIQGCLGAILRGSCSQPWTRSYSVTPSWLTSSICTRGPPTPASHLFLLSGQGHTIVPADDILAGLGEGLEFLYWGLLRQHLSCTDYARTRYAVRSCHGGGNKFQLVTQHTVTWLSASKFVLCYCLVSRPLGLVSHLSFHEWMLWTWNLRVPELAFKSWKGEEILVDYKARRVVLLKIYIIVTQETWRSEQ
jgi:hypothetical protein